MPKVDLWQASTKMALPTVATRVPGTVLIYAQSAENIAYLQPMWRSRLKPLRSKTLMDKETFASLARLLAYCCEEEKDNYEVNLSKYTSFATCND